MKLLVGTSKGLVTYHDTGGGWKVDCVFFEGLPVSMVYVDETSHSWWVALSHRHWGEKLHCSVDEGKSWREVKVPSYGGHEYRPGRPATLKKIWVMQHGGSDRPGHLWLGTEPGGLFFSEDGGAHFTLVTSLWDHPSRQDDHQWFGAGKDYPFIHSILVDPRNSDHVYIGVSCAGVFKTEDGGKTWMAKNKGLIAAYLPNPRPEVGHDPHRMLMCMAHPDVIWQQNHCGVFRTVDGGENWTSVGVEKGMPHYGFALAIDDQRPDRAWAVPAQSDEMRIPFDLELAVCRTGDGGRTWERITHGLSAYPSFDLVLRHAMAGRGDVLAMGTNNGNLYVSGDGGTTWTALSHTLATVNSVVLY